MVVPVCTLPTVPFKAASIPLMLAVLSVAPLLRVNAPLLPAVVPLMMRVEASRVAAVFTLSEEAACITKSFAGTNSGAVVPFPI